MVIAISAEQPGTSAQRAQAILGMIRAQILHGTDHQALTHLNGVWPSLAYEERTAVKRFLQKCGYRGEPLKMLREWAYERLHPGDRPDSPLRPKRRSGGHTPAGREYWPGKRGGPELQGGHPQ